MADLRHINVVLVIVRIVLLDLPDPFPKGFFHGTVILVRAPDILIFCCIRSTDDRISRPAEQHGTGRQRTGDQDNDHGKASDHQKDMAVLLYKIGSDRTDIFGFLHGLSGTGCRPGASDRRCSSRSGRCLSGLDRRILLFDSLLLPPPRDRIRSRLRVFCHPLLIQSLNIGLVRPALQFCCLLIGLQLMAVPDGIRCLRRSLHCPFRFIHGLHTHVVVLMLSDFLVDFSRCGKDSTFHDDFLFQGSRRFYFLHDLFLAETKLGTFCLRRCLLGTQLPARKTGFRLIRLAGSLFRFFSGFLYRFISQVFPGEMKFCRLLLHSHLPYHPSFWTELSIHFVVMIL